MLFHLLITTTHLLKSARNSKIITLYGWKTNRDGFLTLGRQCECGIIPCRAENYINLLCWLKNVLVKYIISRINMAATKILLALVSVSLKTARRDIF